MSSSLDLFAAAGRVPEPQRSALLHAGRRLDLTERVTRCHLCTLSDNPDSNRRVPPEFGLRPLLILGEAPGFYEDQQGRPFVGKSGDLLRRLLSDNVPGVQYSLVNTVQCRPPRNDYSEATRADAPYRCAPYVEQTIELSGAWAALAVGATAMKWFASRATEQHLLPDTVKAARQRPYWSSGVLVFPTYHPAYALRNPEATGMIAEDMRRVAQVFEGVGRHYPLPAADSAALVEAMTRKFTKLERANLADQFRTRGWAMIHSHILGRQIVVVDEEFKARGKRQRKESVIPPEIDAPRWTIQELARIAPKAKAGEFRLPHLLAVDTIKAEMPDARVIV